MAAEVSSDVSFINDEDVLRRMWQQTEDFGRKKEIRARMYKLREQRLREFYTTGEVVNEMASRKHTSTTHADSIGDQGFLTMKTKEIRDSESPTRDIQRRTCDNNYWNTVQESSYSTADDGNTISDSYTLSKTGHGVSEDGGTKMNMAAQEKGFQSSSVFEDDTSKSASEQKGLTTELSSSSHTKTDDGEKMTTSTSKQQQEHKSSKVVSNNKDSSFSSSKWETSSSSSSSRRIVTSSSNYETTEKNALTSDIKAITSADNDLYQNQSKQDNIERDLTDFDGSTVVRNVSKNTAQSIGQESYSKNYEVKQQNSTSFIDNEIRSDINHTITQDHRKSNSQDRIVDKKTYKTELTSTVQDYNTEQDVYQSKTTQKEFTKPEVENVVVDQKIMTELQKLDSFLLTQNTGTSTPVSPHSVTSDAANWTVVSSTDGEFVYRGDKTTKAEKPTEPQQPKRELIKQPSSLDLPKDTTEGQYVTTYQEHYTNKRISVDNSPTHDAFARSLRQSPPASRSSSKASLDRSSPERKHKTSPRASPDKERRVSVGSYTIDKPKESPKRKTSEVVKQTATTKDTKTKRKFSTTQTKAASKTRASTPGASPETSPTRQQRGRTTSPSSQSDSDASQVTYDNTSSTTIKRTDITRRKLEDSFNDENIKKSLEDSDVVRRRPSQDATPVTKSPHETSEKNISGILRKESKTDLDVLSENVTSTKSLQNKQTSNVNTVLLSNTRLRTTSPEYSSEGSVGKEINIKRSPIKESKPSPDSSPERSAFTPIKCFRTSPEVHTLTQEVNINVHHFDVESDVHKSGAEDKREPTKPETPISTRKQSTPDSGMQSPNSDITSRRTPSPSKSASPTRQDIIKKSPSEATSRRSTSPEKKVSPSRQGVSKPTETTIKRPQSPTKEEKLSAIVLSSPKEDHFKKIEQTQKNETKTRPQSPKKDVSFRKASIPKQEPIQNKGVPSETKSPVNSSSPSRRPLSPQKDNFTKRPQSPAKSPSPVRRSSSPKKEELTRSNKSPSPSRRTPSPTKPSYSTLPKETSPQKYSSPERVSKSSSVSPCSSPERPSDRKTTSLNISPVRKPSPQKSIDKLSEESKLQTVRTTRRSSIPRGDQTTVVRKTFENKIEVRTKPVSKIPSSIERRPKPSQSPQTGPIRTGSQSSIDKHTTVKNYKTTVRQMVDKPRELVKKASTKTVKTTAVITLQKPTSPMKKTTTNAVTRVSQTIKKSTPKDTSPTKLTNTNKKPVAQHTNTKRTPTITSPKTKQTDYDNSLSDRSSLMSSPETVRPSYQEQTVGFIERLRHDEIIQDERNSNVTLSFICGNDKTSDLTERTVEIEIAENNIEDETLPEGFTEPDYDDEPPKVVKETVNEISEKTINVEGKRQSSNTFTVTVKKPTGPTRSSSTPKATPVNKNVSTRSSSGPIKPSSVTLNKTPHRPTTPAKKTSPTNKPDTFTRSSSDKNVVRNITTKRQTSKPELTTVKSQIPTNKINNTKQVTETGIATRSVTTAKTATIKRTATPKRKIMETKHDVTSSASSEDEEDIPSVLTTNDKEQTYIEELEEIRREEELEYATKVTATTNKENMLLNVIVQHPKSSRESSPEYSSRGQPYCTVSDDGGSHPRLADMVIEPEDVEVFDKNKFNKPERFTTINEKSFEQVTDLDEESELEELKLNVCVADRVSKFIETTKNVNATTVREEPSAPILTDSPKSVLKAKNMFENIAKNQMAPPAPNNKPVDILSRPSVFEARRGEIAPKKVNSNTFPQRRSSKSPEQMQRRSSFEEITNVDEELHINVGENVQEFIDSERSTTLTQSKVIHSSPSHSPVRPEHKETTIEDYNILSPTMQDDSTHKKPTGKEHPQQLKEVPVRKQSQERKTPLSVDSKTTVSRASNEISSKKAFFERKAQAQTVTTSTKQTSRKVIPQKSQPFKKLPQESSPDRKSAQPDFIENEKRFSRTSPERKASVPTTPTKERKPSVKSSSPDRKESPLPKSEELYENVSQNRSFVRKDSPERTLSRPSKERKESPERQVPTSPVKERKDTPAFTPLKDRKPSYAGESPEGTTAQEKRAKPSRESPERTLVRGKPVSNRDSPDRSFVRDKPTFVNRESPERTTIRDRKPFTKSESPDRTIEKDRRSSINRESPERGPVKDRRSSTNRDSPERTLVKDRRSSANRESPERTPVKDRRPSANRESPERTPVKDRRSSANRESPERSPAKDRRASLNRDSPGRETEVTELNKAGKFGVTLRRTSSTGSGCTTRRTSIPGEPQEIEDIVELELLEQLMEKAVGYEQRRRIRSQIRVVKKTQEDKVTKNYKTTRSGPKSPTRLDSPTREPSTKFDKTPLKTQPHTKPAEDKPSPTEYQKRVMSPVQRPSSPAKNVRDESPELRRTSETKPLTNGYHKPEPSYASPKRKDSSPDRRSPQRTPQSIIKRQDTSPQRTETVLQRGSKSETNVEVTTVRTQKRTETLQEKGVDSITSSYGVGPTDENGRPLFGLKALRRSNTNKNFTDEPEGPAVIKREPEPEVCDARGRPLFGLKALQTSSVDTEDMPEQPGAPQLKELVQKHENKIREPEREPVQKPKAKLRDSFILQQEDEHKPTALEEFNSSQRGLSLRSIIQKHENIAQTGGTAKREMTSSTTVVSSKSTVSSDGSVSLSRDIIQGELSSKNGEEPVGKMTRTEYMYKSPRLEDNQKAVSKVTTTTTQIGSRKLSGPRITELEDDDITRRKIKSSSDRKTSIEQEEFEETTQKKSFSTTRRSSTQKDESETVTKSSTPSRRFSGQKITDDLENGDDLIDENAKNKVYSGKSVTGSTVTTNVRRFSSPKVTDEVNENDEVVQRKSSSSRVSSTTTSSARRTDNTQIRSKTPTSVTKHTSKDEEELQSTEEKKKGLVRGDSVRALQHKFQQATETAANQAQKSYPRAGLILRTSSFKTADEQVLLSSKQKQTTTDKNRQSPEKSSPSAVVAESTVSRSSRVSENTDSGAAVESNYRTTTSSRVTETSTTTTSNSSFLDNKTRVTGVQDILDRMRNADLVVESGDTSEDTEARALLNKFLGASVILQGMEQGMKAAGHSTEITDITPGSAALVSRVEKQRMATTTNRKPEEDIENIWDEKQLRILLEACSDYEGRRQIRARLRTVMAEHKACADVVAVTGQDHGSSSLSQESCESKQVTTKGEGSTVTRTEVHTRTVSSSNRLTKANSVSSSPFAKFKQLERQNSVPSSGSAPLFKFTDPKLVRSASTIKERLLNWVQAQTKDYKNIQIDNFSTSWSNGLAFCALIHHFCPDAFDYDKLTPDQRRHNFELAFRVAEEEAGIAPLLDVEDMVVMRRPDWKCVFTYVQSIYRRYHSTPQSVRY